MAHSLDKPTKAYCLKALDEAVFDILKNQTYSDATAGFLNDKIVAALTQKFKEFPFARYKYVFQVILTEPRGQGLRAHIGCFWDQANDVLTKWRYINDTICCEIIVFAILTYS
ncbi:unnamed protein product [Bursaphelenchus xylophilus]|uniref:(pine wood nematode) hypothetical protein n=1 Tax=Bursaphelenchus xylophilus TaxID=6326 RepID=A0A7I8X3W1_BURXY|nr:unnamed protein product [Bursaphelenchus xylophilus]CAG9128466.1 unnamed protein product [Bursaphelenchus xylophilus]